LQTNRARSKGFLPPTPHKGIANFYVNVNNVKGRGVLFGKGAWRDRWIQEGTMDVSIKPSLEAKIAYVCNLKELLNLEL